MYLISFILNPESFASILNFCNPTQVSQLVKLHM